jgi:hypothetical protein
VESELAIRVKFENGAVSTEKNFAPAAWLARRVASHCEKRRFVRLGWLPTGRAQTSTEELGFQLFAIRELRTYAVTGDWGAS